MDRHPRGIGLGTGSGLTQSSHSPLGRDAVRSPRAGRTVGGDEWRYDVEAMVDGEWLRVVVELPDDPPDVIVVTVIVVE